MADVSDNKIIEYDGFYFFKDKFPNLTFSPKMYMEMFVDQIIKKYEFPYYQIAIKIIKLEDDNLEKFLKHIEKVIDNSNSMLQFYIAFLARTINTNILLKRFENVEWIKTLIELNSINKFVFEKNYDQSKHVREIDIMKDIKDYVLSSQYYIDQVDNYFIKIAKTESLFALYNYLYNILYTNNEILRKELIDRIRRVGLPNDFYTKLDSVNSSVLPKIIKIMYLAGFEVPDKYKKYFIHDVYLLWSDIYVKYLSIKFSQNCIFSFSTNAPYKWECQPDIEEKDEDRCILTYVYNEDLKNCITNSTERLIIIPVTVGVIRRGYHQNILIYDKKTNTLEQFDPDDRTEAKKTFDYVLLKQNIIKSFEEDFDIKDVTYIEPEHFCPYFGPQTLQISQMKIENETDFLHKTCQLWSFVYCYYRLRNPDIPREKLINDLIIEISTKTNPSEYIQKVLSVLLNIENKLKHVTSVEEEIEVYKNAKDIDELF